MPENKFQSEVTDSKLNLIKDFTEESDEEKGREIPINDIGNNCSICDLELNLDKNFSSLQSSLLRSQNNILLSIKDLGRNGKSDGDSFIDSENNLKDIDSQSDVFDLNESIADNLDDIEKALNDLDKDLLDKLDETSNSDSIKSLLGILAGGITITSLLGFSGSEGGRQLGTLIGSEIGNIMKGVWDVYFDGKSEGESGGRTKGDIVKQDTQTLIETILSPTGLTSLGVLATPSWLLKLLKIAPPQAKGLAAASLAIQTAVNVEGSDRAYNEENQKFLSSTSFGGSGYTPLKPLGGEGGGLSSPYSKLLNIIEENTGKAVNKLEIDEIFENSNDSDDFKQQLLESFPDSGLDKYSSEQVEKMLFEEQTTLGTKIGRKLRQMRDNRNNVAIMTPEDEAALSFLSTGNENLIRLGNLKKVEQDKKRKEDEEARKKEQSTSSVGQNPQASIIAPQTINNTVIGREITPYIVDWDYQKVLSRTGSNNAFVG